MIKYCISLILLLVAFTIPLDLEAQCAMCKAVVESSTEGGGTTAGGINDGIVYLMGVPYLLIMTAGYFIYRNYKRNNSGV